MSELTLQDALTQAFSSWRQGERIEGLAAILRAVLQVSQAERALLISVVADGSYRLIGSRNLDDEVVFDAERSIAHFAVTRARDSQSPTLFSDTRLDRRFRTEAERDHGTKTRSIWIAPLHSRALHGSAPQSADPTAAEPAAYLYLDSRFREIRIESAESELRLAVEVLSFWWRQDRQDGEVRTLERRVQRLRRTRHEAPPRAPRVAVRVSTESEREIDYHGFLTRCPELIAELKELQGLAESTLSVLIEGETGTGKEVLARALHKASGRTGEFVSLHCGSIPSELVEVELFGHARGAFTGADQARSGLIDAARDGTLFLDDVGNMTPELQNALLRVLETKRFRPLSDPEEREANARVLSSRRIGDDSGIEGYSLREDLYFRLAGARVRIPPLRDRGEDIPLLTRLFLDRYRGAENPEVSEELAAALLTYHWPGNTRELENVVRRMLALGGDDFGAQRFAEITGLEMLDTLEGAGDGTPVAPPGLEDGRGRLDRGIHAVVDRAEREAIIRALHQHGGNKSHAARALGLSRKTLYRRMEKHGIPL